MKAVILAGGLGTRISEESDSKPKPMVEIGGRPILWHIMKHFSSFGITEFVIATGYRGYQIKEYFANYFEHNSDFRVDLETGISTTIGATKKIEPWKVSIVDTGLETQTGGRLLRLKEYIGHEDFFLTYGDGLTNANLNDEINFHRLSSEGSTVLAVRPPARFAQLIIDDNENVTKFEEKPVAEGGWINGGYFIFRSDIFSLLSGDDCVLEKRPLEVLAATGRLRAFRHGDFWMAMDTLRDKRVLESYWQTGKAPWVVDDKT